MNVRNCRNCGRIFNYVMGPFLCPRCREKLEEKFQIVKEYIREHPGITIPEVSEACEVDPSQIRQWLREERLQLSEDSPIYLNCDGCGALIRCGKYCDKCKTNTTRDLQSVLKQNVSKMPETRRPDPTNPKMRYF
ncbi:MAG: flagellar protein [Lachnospiraceae bacterium]|nr:flagellar protein [Lachnospiraceae bacterium]